MSIIFGVRKPEGLAVAEQELLGLARATCRWAPDGDFICVGRNAAMGFQPYHTHERSHLESQPLVDDVGNMVALDGRLDNYKDLCDLLDIDDQNTADSRIALEAFRRWGEECFSKLIGDWAIVMWDQVTCSLYLARDHAGTRTLYYERCDDTVYWGTYLETLCVHDRPRKLSSAYISAYLLGQLFGGLTPFEDIISVCPGTYVVIRANTTVQKRHWQQNWHTPLLYRSDKEYEEHFLTLFRQSVARRTGGGAPVLAQLSGGIDSSSIVCISDLLRKNAGLSTRDLVDTISFLDNTEPDWDDKQYFTTVERQRGKSGIHFDVSSSRPSFKPIDGLADGVPLLPGFDGNSRERERILCKALEPHGYRVILSGLGGDELLGGVPTPYPELADILVSGNLVELIRRALPWCVSQRIPIVSMLWRTAGETVAAYRHHRVDLEQIPPWLRSSFKQRLLDVSLVGYAKYKKDRRPSHRIRQRAWETLVESLPSPQLFSLERKEYRYPYLDRDLVEFLLRVPRNQLVRPGRRRSLMRRALAGTIPDSVLERRRKAYISRSPILAVRDQAIEIEEVACFLNSAGFPYIDLDVFATCLEKARCQDISTWHIPVLRTALLGFWIRSLASTRGEPSQANQVVTV
jgi:asparagine synthase (glutamine-hydrolysing)